MTKTKVESTKTGGFGMKGGNQHMFRLQGASPQVPGQSASPEGRNGSKFIGGGSGNHMFGPQHADPQQPGVSGHATSGAGMKFAEGGKGPNNKMFGKQCAGTATPGASVK